MPVVAEQDGAQDKYALSRTVSAGLVPPCLASGSVFHGCQRSVRSTYAVSVAIQAVDLPGSSLCGYLTITGLTSVRAPFDRLPGSRSR